MSQIKILKLVDIPEASQVCTEWLFNEWGHRTPNSTLEQAVKKFLTRLNRNHIPIAFVAISGDEIVGTASLVEYEGLYTSLRPWVSGVFVPKRWRGQGIAKELISAIEAEAQKLGYFCLWLSASVPDMYLRLGYTFSELYKGEEQVMFKHL